MSGRRFIRAAIACLVSATCVLAQPSLHTGQRVRVTMVASTDTLVGQVAGSDSAGFALTSADSSRRVIPFSSVAQLEVSLGRRHFAVLGGILGVLVSGGAFVALACAFSNGSCDIGADVGGFLLYYATGAIPGSIGGALLGMLIHRPERWRTVWPVEPAK